MQMFRRNGNPDMLANERQGFDWNVAMPWILTLLFGAYVCVHEFWNTSTEAASAVSDITTLQAKVAAHDVKLAHIETKLGDMDSKLDDIGQDIKSLVNRHK